MNYADLEWWQSTLEATFHGILKVRGLYHEEIFERRRIFGLVTYRARHRRLRKYIGELVSGVTRSIVEQKIDQLLFTIESASGKPLEQYVFAIEPRIALQSNNNGRGLSAQISDFEEAFRSCVEGTCHAGKVLPQLPPACTFKVSMHVRDNNIGNQALSFGGTTPSLKHRSQICSLSGRPIFVARQGTPELRGEGGPLDMTPLLKIEFEGVFPTHSLNVHVYRQAS